MATETRPGIRLPWTAATGEADDQPAAGETAGAEETQAHEMIDTADTADTTDTADTAESPTASDQPAEQKGAESQPARRATKFMADLSRAMQAAAESARSETMARFEVEAKAVVEEVRARATDEAADLRRKADDDVATIREWSKAEVARIRDETETRIAARKSGLDSEVEQHAAMIETRVERVTAVVAAFEAQMATFFEHLNAEEDPTRIATMAETMPDPPSLAEVAASIAVSPSLHATEPAVAPSIEPSATTPQAETSTGIDFAAAEAEAASFSGDLDNDDDELVMTEPGARNAEAGEDPAPSIGAGDGATSDLASTQVVVSGLVSVANIANFKRSLTRTPGVSKIAVASGPDGDFVFTVGHTLGPALSGSIQALPGFDIQIIGESDEAIDVAAQDRDSMS